MIVYANTLKEFNNDIINNLIADKIQQAFAAHNYSHNNDSEYKAWENSLRCMHMILIDEKIDRDCKVAVEYQIPLTAKRVDFIITGKNP